jgi:glycosyltransferase involved in cell wall biosynthesis
METMRIAQVLFSNSWGEITPDLFEKGVGGREGAMMRLATEWAKLGHEVTNFVPVENSLRTYGTRLPSNDALGFHEYVPINLARPMLESFPYDAVVAWECPSVFASEKVMKKQKVRLVHMQVAHFNPGEEEAAEKHATGVVALSEWHKEFLVHSGLNHPNLYVRPNGIDLSNYPPIWNKSDLPSFVYSSSPDRGLWHLLKMWREIRLEFKDTSLVVAYGVSDYIEKNKWLHSRVGEMSLEIEYLLKQPGIMNVGRIGQKALARYQMDATAFLYPCDPIGPTETGCITAIENMAAGNPCIMTDADCLEDEFGQVAMIHSLPLDYNEYIGSLIEILHDPFRYERMMEEGRAFAETRDWKVIAPSWLELFEESRS